MTNILISSKLDPVVLLNELEKAGFEFFSGVPCSTQAPLFNSFYRCPSLHYTPATHPGEAMFIALGSELAGHKAVVLCQNTALGDIVLPLVISRKLGLPLLILLSWRSMHTSDPNDILGQMTVPLLDLLELSHETISSEITAGDLKRIIDKACLSYQNGKSFVILTAPGTFIPTKPKVSSSFLSLKPQKPMVYKNSFCDEPLPSRLEILTWLRTQRTHDMIVLSPEGNCTRELFAVGDNVQNLYLCPLGYVSSIGLGLSLNTQKKVVVLDGDGSILMRLQNLATIGFCQASNFIHILFNNLLYETTGSQPTVSEAIDFSKVIEGFHYKTLHLCSNLDSFKKAFRECLVQKGPHFLYIDVNPSKTEFSSLPHRASFYAQRLKKFLSIDCI